MSRADTGRTNYHGGLVAEALVASDYERRGHTIAHRRWRGSAGEIDLIARDGDAIVFVEVKAAATHATAAERLSGAQASRIYATASEFLADEPNGQESEVRFDVALVDAVGRIEIIEAAIWG